MLRCSLIMHMHRVERKRNLCKADAKGATRICRNRNSMHFNTFSVAIKINACYRREGSPSEQFGSSYFHPIPRLSSRPDSRREKLANFRALSDERKMLETELFMLFTRQIQKELQKVLISDKKAFICEFSERSIFNALSRDVKELRDDSWKGFEL